LACLVAKTLFCVRRSVVDVAALMAARAAQDQGSQVVALDLGLDTSPTTGRMVAHILAVVAAAEREVIGQRMSAALITKCQRGENVGRRSRLPAEVVPRVVAAREDGMTYAAVAESLNVDGIRPAREASAGNPSTVRAVPSSQAAEHGVLGKDGAAGC
jgi:DNA invertase Pin-like site-specific DNA recombinase